MSQNVLNSDGIWKAWLLILILAILKPASCAGGESIQVTCLSKSCNIEGLWRVKNVTLMAEYDWPYQENVGAYFWTSQPMAEIWCHVPKNTREELRPLFPAHHFPVGWYQVNGTNWETVVVKTVVMEPRRLSADVVVFGEKDGNTFVIQPDGEVLPSSESKLPLKISSHGIPTSNEGQSVVRFVPLQCGLRYAPGVSSVRVEYCETSPFPRGIVVPIDTSISVKGGPVEEIRPGFEMWNNAGRESSPDMNHFQGNGIRISFRGKTTNLGKNAGLPSDRVSCAWVDEDEVWCGFYDASPVRIDPKQMTISKELLKGRHPTGISLITACGGFLLVGTFSQGLFVIDKARGAIQQVTGVPESRVNAICTDGKNAWVATAAGLFLVELP